MAVTGHDEPTPEPFTVACRRCGQPVAISAADRADMLINGGGFTHKECPDG